MRKGIVIAGGTATGLGAAGLGFAVARRRRSATPSPPFPSLDDLDGPAGEDRVVNTPDGAKLALTVTGGAGDRRFVLVHGWVCDRTTWVPVARRLASAGHRVALYDQRGHGQSTFGDEGLTIEALGDDLKAVIDDLGWDGVVVAGHSMGGMAAQSFAVRHPDFLAERVRGLALVSTACDRVGFGGVAARVSRQVVANPAVDKALAHSLLGPWLVRGSAGRRPARVFLDSVRSTFAATSPEVRVGCFDAMRAMDLSEALAGVGLPTVVMVGSRDLLTLPARSRRLAEVIPGARLQTVTGAGHMLPFEAPERVAEVLLSL